MTNTTPTEDWLDDPKVISALECLSIQKNNDGKWFADDWRYDVTSTMEDLKAAITAHYAQQLVEAEKIAYERGFSKGKEQYDNQPRYRSRGGETYGNGI